MRMGLESQVASGTYHDCFALILDNMAGPSNLITSAKTEEHELIRRIHGLLGGCRGHRRRLPLGSHGLDAGQELDASGEMSGKGKDASHLTARTVEKQGAFILPRVSSLFARMTLNI